MFCCNSKNVKDNNHENDIVNNSIVLKNKTDQIIRNSISLERGDVVEITDINLIQHTIGNNKELFKKTKHNKEIQKIITNSSPMFYMAKKYKKGISVIISCMNRNNNLLKNIESLLPNKNIDEIIIVDWSSIVTVYDTLHTALINGNKKIIILRIVDQDTWNLTTSYNIASRFVSYNKLLKLDADYVISNDFLKVHKLKKKIFYRGNWANSTNDNEKCLNGFLFLYTKDFFKVGGYNEKIQTYGWDDSDIYERLNKCNIKDVNIINKHIIHIKHATILNTVDQNKSIQTNRIFCSMPEGSWDCKNNMTNIYKWSEYSYDLEQDCNINYYFLTIGTTSIPHSLYDNARKEYSRLYGDVINTKEYDNFNIFYCKPINGLGNRLRCFASCYNLYKNLSNSYTKNEKTWKFILIWVLDDHCNCEFDTLFELKDLDIEIITRKPLLPDYCQNLCVVLNKNNSVYGNNVNNHVDNILENELTDCKNICLYAESSCIIQSKYYSYREDANFLQNLKVTEIIQNNIDYQLDRLNFLNLDITTFIGVCIREGQDAKYDDTTNWGNDQKISWSKWRKCSTYDHFIKKMKSMGDDTYFYITADNKDVYDKIRKDEEINKRVFYTTRNEYDRSKSQIIMSLVDILLVAKCKLILGSNWSSFSELAKRYSTAKMILAGVDF